MDVSAAKKNISVSNESSLVGHVMSRQVGVPKGSLTALGMAD
jgi:hypothetical protein